MAATPKKQTRERAEPGDPTYHWLRTQLPDAKRLRLLRLRGLLAFPPAIVLDGPLIQRHNLGARDLASKYKEVIEETLQRRGWRMPPRAKIWTAMSFASTTGQMPALHRVPKYYLDLLKGLVFRDDRQVEALEVRLSPRSDRQGVLILFDRLSQVRKKKAIAASLGSSFREWDPWEDNELDEMPDNFFSEAQDRWRQWQLLDRSATTTHWYEYPLRDLLPNEVRLIRDTDPFLVSLGTLPAPGGSAAYRDGLRTEISRFLLRYPLLQQLSFPVEVDVQVTRKALRFSKDLDNIMRDVVPVLREQLSTETEIQGYRIHVVSGLGDDKPGQLWLKLLPSSYSLQEEWRTNEVLEEAIRRAEGDGCP